MADPVKTRVFLNSAEEAAYDREQLRNSEGRGTFIPFKKDAEGNNRFAIPQWLRDTWNNIRLPSDVLKGYQPSPQENTEFALNVGLGGMSASKIAGVEADPDTLGMFLGKRAKGADTKKLATAMSMQSQGKSPEEIWASTGWFEGLDGQWKWEIPDNNFDINRAGLQETFDIQVGKGAKRFSTPPEPTSSAIKHKELFDNYPAPEGGRPVPSHGTPPIHVPYTQKTGVPGTSSFRETNVVPTTFLELFASGAEGPGIRYKGGYSGGNFQDLSAGGVDLDTIRWVMAHELQHAVQEREGFAQGANVTAIENSMVDLTKSLPDNVVEYVSKKVKIQQLEEELGDLKKSPKSEDSYNYMMMDENADVLYSKQQELQTLNDVTSAMEKEMEGYLPEVKEITNFLTRSRFNNYQREAGEAEARLVQTRLDRSPEQNAATYPLSELDVPKEEVWTQKSLTDLVKSITDKEQDAWEASLRKVGQEESKKGYEQSLEDMLNGQQSYAKGGMVIDPVSGNEVPPGAKPEEVRDDINIKASEGEYVIPANVVRFLGLDKIEKMVSKAKEALAEMHGDGRIGGVEGSVEDDSLPFDPSELVAHAGEEEMQAFAEGGVVQDTGGGTVLPQEQGFTGTKKFKKGDQVIFIPYQNGQPFLPVPQGYTEVAEGAPTATPDPNMAAQPLRAPGMPRQSMGNGPSPNEGIPPSPLAGEPSKWTADNFIDYGKQKGSLDSKLIKGMISVLPGGAMALKAREKYLDSQVTQLFDTMMDSGVDPMGNPITPEQRAVLSETRQNLKSQMSESSGLNLNPIERLTDAFSQFQNFLGGKPLQKPQSFKPSGQAQGKPISSLSPQGTAMVNNQGNKSDNQYAGGNVSVGSDLGKQNNGPTSGSMRSGGLYSKGGLVARRKK
jgi:hypothetical protein